MIDADGRVRAYGLGGNANHQGQGLDRALCHVATAVHAALEGAGVAPERLGAAHFALAGNDTAYDDGLLTARLRETWPELRFSLGNDVWAGLRAGALDGYGVAINCGSGTGSVGRNRHGATVMIPDLGYIYGDSGGGGQIATDAFRAVSREADGRGEPTALTPALLELTGCATVEDLRMALYHNSIGRDLFRAATRLVLRAAGAGDAVANAILRRIGEEMGLSAATVARRLGLLDEAFTLVLTGGVLRTLTSPLAVTTIERVRRDAPRCLPVLPRVMPVAGAALLALDTYGAPVTPAHYAALCEQGYSWHPEERFGGADEADNDGP